MTEKNDDVSHDRLLIQAVALLQQVPTGKMLLEMAAHTWKMRSAEELLQHLQWGAASKTDAVLIRHFDPESGVESRERQITIYIKARQPLNDLVLDIAHELVHATSRPVWDPYDPDLTAGRYIRAAIEGEGGEVAAVRAECQVSREFVSRSLAKPSMDNDRCGRYLESGTTDRIRKDFYRVGKWNDELLRKLGKESLLLPELSPERPMLYSSTGGAPYPVALWEEFRQITVSACENSRKRAAAFSRDTGRNPASTTDAQRATLAFLSRRCDL